MTLLGSVLSPHWPHGLTGGPLTSRTAAPADPPVVALLLHGFGSNERDLPGLARWLPADLPWASLRAPLDMGYGAAAWFPLSPSGDMDPTAISRATTQVWDWIDASVPEHTRILPMGFSQGGLMALELLRSRPDRVVAPVVLAGFVNPAVHSPGDQELRTSLPPVFWGRGDADQVIWPAAIDATRAWLSEHATVTARVYPGLTHSVDEREMDDVAQFVSAHLG